MAIPRKRAKVGDIIEVQTPEGLAYLHFTSKHLKYGDTVRIFPGFVESRPENVSSLVAGDTWFFAWYPVGAAVHQGLVTVVGNSPVPPGCDTPSVWRRAGWRNKDGKAETWLICDSSGEVLRRELSPEEQKLPVAAIWNHEMLVIRLSKQWRPEQEA